MRKTSTLSTVALRACAVAGLLACTAFAVQASTNFSVGVNLGFPVVGSYGGYGHDRGYYGGGGHYGRGYYGRGYYGAGYRGRGYRSYGSGVLFLAPPLVYAAAPDTIADPVVVQQQPVTPPRPDPVIYPRTGQSAQQTEADRQECNRWATTQPAALADAGVFHRAVEACMDGRGYTMK